MARKGSVQSQHGDGVGRKESMRSRKSAATESEVGIVAVALFRSGEEACILLLTLLAVFCSQIESDDLDSLVSDAESEVSIARKQSVKSSQVPLLCFFSSSSLSFFLLWPSFCCVSRPAFACFSVSLADGKSWSSGRCSLPVREHAEPQELSALSCRPLAVLFFSYPFAAHSHFCCCCFSQADSDLSALESDEESVVSVKVAAVCT